MLRTLALATALLTTPVLADAAEYLRQDARSRKMTVA
jgi:hypothetical protein